MSCTNTLDRCRNNVLNFLVSTTSVFIPYEFFFNLRSFLQFCFEYFSIWKELSLILQTVLRTSLYDIPLLTQQQIMLIMYSPKYFSIGLHQVYHKCHVWISMSLFSHQTTWQCRKGRHLSTIFDVMMLSDPSFTVLNASSWCTFHDFLWNELSKSTYLFPRCAMKLLLAQ